MIRGRTAAPVVPFSASMERFVNATASQPDLRAIPLAHLVLAPENVRTTPPSPADQAQLTVSIQAHGVLESLVVRSDEPAPDGSERFAVIAGGRRLSALNVLLEDGNIDAAYPVPCQIVSNDNSAELSLVENVMRIAMHPADQVVAFKMLADAGSTAASIAARFGVTERLVEQRLRLGSLAPQLLDAYRADQCDLETLKAFTITSDHERQLAVWNQLAQQGYRPSGWQVRRIITDEPIPATAAIARFVGLDAYQAAGGPVLRDLFADEDDRGIWFEDQALLNDLATRKLVTVADELSLRWKWAEAMPEADWSTTASYGRIHPVPGEPTDDETAEIERLRTRHDELANLDEEEWTEELADEAESIDTRLHEIEATVEARSYFRPDAFAMAGCIATIARDGSLHVIAGLVHPEDIPANTGNDAAGSPDNNASSTAAGQVDNPAYTAPFSSAPDPATQARKKAGVGIGLADDLRAIRTAIVKAHLSRDFEAAFDLMLFQIARAVFSQGYMPDALDIMTKPTPDRPSNRHGHDDFASWSPAEATLEDLSHLSFDWMEIEDDGEAFAAMCALPAAEKQSLFAAATARTVKGQLAFEHHARPELEATVARLDIDFASTVRPTADMFWSRVPKKGILDIARATLGQDWAVSHGKFRKPDLAKAMDAAIRQGRAARRCQPGRPRRRSRLGAARLQGLRRRLPLRPRRPQTSFRKRSRRKATDRAGARDLTERALHGPARQRAQHRAVREPRCRPVPGRRHPGPRRTHVERRHGRNRRHERCPHRGRQPPRHRLPCRTHQRP